MPNDLTSFDQDLMAIVAHDLKIPLTAVRGYLELIGKFGELNERQKHFAERAMLGLDRMERFITSVLEFARLEGDIPMEFVDCDLTAIIDAVVELVEHPARQRNIAIHIDLPETLTPITGDPQWLSELLSNLLSNAVKYNRQDGSVWVSVVDNPGVVMIAVRDTGQGIAPDDQVRVFDRFFRARAARAAAEGSGLGLAIAQAVVEKHQGQIWLESTPGEGSTFFFTLPRQPRTDETDERVDGELISEERSDVPHTDTGLELPDAIDDNMQESDGAVDLDSTNESV